MSVEDARSRDLFDSPFPSGFGEVPGIRKLPWRGLWGPNRADARPPPRSPVEALRPVKPSGVDPLAPARFVAPMKALNSDRIPSGTWHCEIKFDGYRAVAVINSGDVELWSRNQKSIAAQFPEVVGALEKAKCRNAVLDGEIVALDPEGRSSFQLLQGRGLRGDRPAIVYYLFDIMHRDGTDLMRLPLSARRRHLQEVAGKLSRSVQLSPVFNVEPAELFDAAKKNRLEGVIAKVPDSTYEPDRRSGAWIKCKVLAEQEFVIGGFTPPQNSREHFGALLIGYFDSSKLLYAGKVGTGFNRSLLDSLHATLLKIRATECPFDNLPRENRSRFGTGMGPGEMKKVSWVKPVLVAQVKFAEWTDDGILRHPVFLGLRMDKPPTKVVKEKGPILREKGTASRHT